MRLAVAILFLALILVRPVDAQQNVVVINGGVHMAIPAGKPQTVTVNFQLSWPAPDISSSQDMTNAMAATTQSLYDIVNRECDVLTAALKGTCRLSHLNVGGNLNGPGGSANWGNRGNLVNANANATYEIEPPPAASPPASSPPAPPAAPK